jgi:predicted HicB family RNase H-like nuclease
MDKSPYHINNPVIGFRIKKSMKELIKNLAEKDNVSINKYMNELIVFALSKKGILEIEYKFKK